MSNGIQAAKAARQISEAAVQAGNEAETGLDEACSLVGAVVGGAVGFIGAVAAATATSVVATPVAGAFVAAHSWVPATGGGVAGGMVAGVRFAKWLRRR